MMAAFASDFRDGIDINLGVGYVNEKTIPAALLAEAMQAVVRHPVKYRQAFNYGGPEGSANLIASLRRFLAGSRVGGLDEAALNRKRLIYCDALQRRGFEVLAVPEDDQGIDPGALSRKLEALGGRTREIAFFYVVTVNNPSCTILSNSRRRALVEVASPLSLAGERRIPVFFDGAYELLLHDPRAGIERSLGPHLAGCRGGRAGFYYYLTFARIETHPESAFFKYLTRPTGEPRVIYIPGEYCVHPRGDLVKEGRRQLRLSYGFEESDTILRALELMREAVEFAGCQRSAMSMSCSTLDVSAFRST